MRSDDRNLILLQPDALLGVRRVQIASDTEGVGQRLILMIPARIPAETLINGAIWLDEVKIQRVEPLL